MKKTTTVVICTKNRHASCLLLLNSLKGQIGGADEIILIDNNQTPDKELQKNALDCFGENNIRYYHQNKGPLARLRQFGLKNAKGEIVAFTDDDALVDKNWIKEIKKSFSKKADGVTGLVKSTQKSSYSLFSEKLLSFYLGDVSKKKKVDIMVGVNFAIKKSFILNNKIAFKKNLHSGEETDLSIQIKEVGGNVFFIPQAVVFHDFRNGFFSFIKRNFEYAYYDFLIFKERAFKFDFCEYLPYSSNFLNVFLSPLFFPIILTRRTNRLCAAMGVSFLLYIFLRETALFSGLYYSFIRNSFLKNNLPYYFE